jgi:uncharacterized protein (TIGR02246 family)
LLTGTIWSSTCAAQSKADEKAILNTLDSWNQGWAESDAALAVRDYAEDTDWTNAFGDRFEGKAMLREGLEHIFSLGFVMAGQSAGNEYTDIRFLAKDVAIVRSKLIRTGRRTSAGDEMPARQCLLDSGLIDPLR